MWCRRGAVYLLTLTLLLSGCTGPDDTTLDPPPGEGGTDEPTENATDPDEDPPPWTYRFEHEDSVDGHACIDVVFCTVFAEGDGPFHLSFLNATIIRLGLVAEWDEENGTGEDRVLTVECWDEENSDCTGFPGPIQATGGTPLVLDQDGVQVPPGTTLNVTVSLQNQAPEPIILRHDETFEFLLTGELLLDTVRPGDEE